MPTRVFLMRHAQTDRPTIFHGYESDADLSELGFRQAAALAPIIAAQKPVAIISSGMKRARLTATPMAKLCGLPLRIEEQLHERKIGELVGTSTLGEFGDWHDTLAEWSKGNTAATSPGAESFDQVRDRVLPVWERLLSEFAGKSIAIVAHGIVCRVLLLSWLPGYSARDWLRVGRIPNASISEVVVHEGKREAVRIAEIPPEIEKLGKG